MRLAQAEEFHRAQCQGTPVISAQIGSLQQTDGKGSNGSILVEHLSIILVPKRRILVVMNIIGIGGAELLGLGKFVRAHCSEFGMPGFCLG